MLAFQSTFKFMGVMPLEMIKTTDPEPGLVYLAEGTDDSYVADGHTWQLLSKPSDTNSNVQHEIKRTKCPSCGANLSIKKVDDFGMCRCEYCKNEWFVW